MGGAPAPQLKGRLPGCDITKGNFAVLHHVALFSFFFIQQQTMTMAVKTLWQHARVCGSLDKALAAGV